MKEAAWTIALCFATAALVLLPHAGCGANDCRSGQDDCIVASPCTRLSYTCDDGFVRMTTLGPGDDRPGGLDALASDGDYLLENDRIRVVVDALDHQHYVAATGGMILDLATQGRDDDSINHIFQATGLLPEDAAHYTSVSMIEEEGMVALVFRGALDGFPDQKIATRYELHPCEPGIRVRTEFVNLDGHDNIVTLTDGWYWSGRSAVPFTPLPGIGFVHQDFGLSDIQDVFHEVPLMAAAGHSDPAAAYAVVACSDDTLEGFQSDQVSAMGTRRRVISPRSSEVFERFIVAAPGNAIGPAVDLALETRRQLFGEPWLTLSGSVTSTGGGAQISIESGDTPLTQLVPNADGTYAARVPARDAYRVVVSSFGRVAGSADVTPAGPVTEIPPIDMPAVARLELDATVDGETRDVLVFLHPADDTTRDAVAAKYLGNFAVCAPLLGPPHGGSPACNRVLVNGPTTVVLPPGRYDAYATAGPFVSLSRETFEVDAGGSARADFALTTVPVQPAGTLSADFHVHGAASFDSSIPDADRVRAFVAASMDVIVATDHDVVHDYAEARDALSIDDRLVVITGVETTGQVLWDLVPDNYIPKVIGHYNFWPLERRDELPRQGAPPDELVEPQELFERAKAAGLPDDGVRQLNHPWADADFGRDLGFPRALEVDTHAPPPKQLTDNLGHDVQEVMNGTNNEAFAAYRAFWFYLLNHGIVRGGTANSDSHGLTDNVLGTPRTLVYTDTTTAAFDRPAFDAAVKRGRMLGTNGPVIEVATMAADGSPRVPSMEPFDPSTTATLEISVRAAPWVPVAEVRIIVNGEVVRTLESEMTHPADPFGTTGLTRFEGRFSLSELLPAEGDAWLVVEAGAPLVENADLDCDGIPDTGDNDKNGTIDWRDAEDNESEPGECDGEIGPLGHPAPAMRDSPEYHFEAVTPEGFPLAFTNPLLFDRNGDGFSGAGR